MEIGIKSIIGVNVSGKRVLFRPDINSPIDKQGRIVNTNRLEKTVPTLKYLADGGAKIAIIAHQGDTLDYQNLISMREHAEILSKLSGVRVAYLDDVAGDAAIEAVRNLKAGEAVLLGNLRYLTEEVSTFEKDVKLTADEMLSTYLVRRLGGLFDVYVNDAFSAAHRNAPSMVAFQKLMPSYAGPLFFKEYEALWKVLNGAAKPVVFVLGGAKISDAFGMMGKVLKDGVADKILATGVTGVVMQLARGVRMGAKYEKWLKDRDLSVFVDEARELLKDYADKFVLPTDFAVEENGKRREVGLNELPLDDKMFSDIGEKSILAFEAEIKKAGTIFVNGPAGVYENELFAEGTSRVWKAVAAADGYSVIGGGDTVSAAARFVDLNDVDYVCTAGGAMVRFLSGKRLPLIEAMLNAK